MRKFVPRKRDLDKKHVIFQRQQLDPKRGRPVKVRVAVPEGMREIREQRRWAPGPGGKTNNGRAVEGTAEELFMNLGVEKRGLGTRQIAANAKKILEKKKQEKWKN